jgi:hypothetical protein
MTGRHADQHSTAKQLEEVAPRQIESVLQRRDFVL